MMVSNISNIKLNNHAEFKAHLKGKQATSQAGTITSTSGYSVSTRSTFARRLHTIPRKAKLTRCSHQL